MKKTTTIPALLATTFLICSPTLCFAEPVTIKVDNLLAVTEVTDFLGLIMTKMQSIVAFLVVLVLVVAGTLYFFAGANEGLVKTAQSMIAAALGGLAIFLAAPAFIKQIQIVLFPNQTLPTNLDEVRTLTEVMSAILAFLLSMTGILAVISLVFSGFIFLFDLGTGSQVEKAKKIATYSIWGIIIVGSSLILVKQIVKLITE